MPHNKESLGRLRAITSTAADLGIVEASWCGTMGYQVLSREAVDARTAASWGAPALAGKPMLVLGPADGEPVYLRFVEQPDLPDFAPLTTIGWGGIELVVQDPDALAATLADSPFEVLLAPHGVDGYPYLTALQAAGPSNERLNLTRIDPAQPDLPIAGAPVGHCFIATLGVPDIEAARTFYAEIFGCPVTPVHHVRLSLVNLALGLSRDTRHPLTGVTLAGRSMIELDEFPEGSQRRAIPDGGLPPGLAIVTFDYADLAADEIPWIAPATAGQGGFAGGRTRTARGAAGELIELIAPGRQPG